MSKQGIRLVLAGWLAPVLFWLALMVFLFGQEALTNNRYDTYTICFVVTLSLGAGTTVLTSYLYKKGKELEELKDSSNSNPN